MPVAASEAGVLDYGKLKRYLDLLHRRLGREGIMQVTEELPSQLADTIASLTGWL